MKSLRCWLFGHEPRGPISIEAAVLYQCDRCNQVIFFDKDKGWKVIDYD